MNGNMPSRYQVTAAPIIQDGAATSTKQSKSRNGCTTCKTKRLKCDESKPSCIQCQKRGVACAGYQRDYKWRTFEGTKVKTKPNASKKILRPHPSPAKQHTSRSRNIGGANSDGSGGVGIPGLQYGDFDGFILSALWSPTLHSESVISVQEGQAQHHGRVALTCPELQGTNEPDKASRSYLLGTTNSNVTSPFNDEGISPGLSFCDPIEPCRSGASDAESSAANTNSASSFVERSPQLLHVQPGRNDNQPPEPPELQLHNVDMNMNRDLGEQVVHTDAISTTNELTLPLITSPSGRRSTSTSRAPPISSPAPSVESSWSSDSDDMATHVGPSSAECSPEMIMQRFDQQTCSILSVKDGPTENPWRTLIWPLAAECPALYHAISSMTAFHGVHENPMLHTPGMAHMTKSIRRLASEIENMRLDYALATSLALAFSEGWESHVSTGMHHLRAAGVMVKSLMIKHRHDMQSGQLTSEDASRLRFLCNTFVYMDVVARLTSFEEVSEIDIEQILATFNAPFEDHIEVDPLMGCAMTLFPLIGRVANLIRGVYKTESNSLMMVSTAIELKEQIEKWQVQKAVVYESPEDPNCDIQHSIQTAEAYRYATLLYLHQAIPEIPSEPAQQLAKKVLFKLAAVPLSSGSMIVQIFPLFTASCEVTDPDDRSWVKQRWAAMTARLKIGNVQSCWGVVQEVWSRRDVFQKEQASRVRGRYQSRGYPRERPVSPLKQIPLSLKRKASNEKGIVYQDNDNPESQHQRGGNAITISGSWGAAARDELGSEGRPLKRPAKTSSTSIGLSTSIPTRAGSGCGFNWSKG